MYCSKMEPIIPTEEQQLPTAFLTDIRSIIDTGRRQAYAAVGQSAIATFWNVGRRIVEEEQNGQGRAAYGTELIKNLAERLIPVYGTSYSNRNLDYYRKFYLLFPNEEIVNARVHNSQKAPNRNYENTQHWNPEAEYLEPLKAFFENNIL